MFPRDRRSSRQGFLGRSPNGPPGPNGPFGPKTPFGPNGSVSPKIGFGDGGIGGYGGIGGCGGIGGRGGTGHSGREPLRSDKASMTARMSHALVEIPSEEAISSTRALTDWGSLSVMRATGSSSVSSVGDSLLASSPDSGSGGSSKVGSASAV